MKVIPSPLIRVGEHTRVKHVYRPEWLGGPKAIVRDRMPDGDARAGWRPWSTYYPAVWS